VTEPLSPYEGVRALVLGASGFIGRWVARRLVAARSHVTCAVREPAAFAEVARQWSVVGPVVAFDALSNRDARDLVLAAQPDVVFNLIGYGVDRTETNADVMHSINCDLVRRIVAAIADAGSTRWQGRRLVHIGSALEYGEVTGIVREDVTPMPHTDYGRTKLAGTLGLQEAARDRELSAVTARAFTVFGPGEHRGRLLPTIREAAAAGKTVRLSAGTQRRDFAYVEDVADGLLRIGASSGAPGEVVNLATGRLTSVREFAESAAAVYGLTADRLVFGAEPIRSDEMEIAGVDIDRLRTLTGWTPPGDLPPLLRRASSFEAAVARDSH
jgi:nucleoside-diphosphate-sugar epimerase